MWVTDIAQHRTCEGWVHATAILAAYSRRGAGWSIADHLRTELVADALDTAWLRRKAVGGTNTPVGYSATYAMPASWDP